MGAIEKAPDKTALWAKFVNNPRHTPTPLSLEAKSDSQFFIFMNAICLRSLNQMFTKAFSNDLNLMNLYSEAAKSKAA